jgi:putative transposase
VRRLRQRQPRLGARKLLWLLQPLLASLGVRLGRDRLFAVLREHGLLIAPRRSGARTTQSKHGFAVAENVLKQTSLSRPNQAWVSDITYIRTLEGFCYVALITDAYSRAIVGFDVSASLSIEGSLRALTRAIGSQPTVDGLLHHSDRGVQYCSTDYRQLLAEHQITVSMAAVGDPYENAIAERVNGTLKHELALAATFRTRDDAARAVREAVEIYNHERPHLSLNYQTPSAVHGLLGCQ